MSKSHNNPSDYRLKNMTTPITHESLNRAIGFTVITAVLVALSLILVLLG